MFAPSTSLGYYARARKQKREKADSPKISSLPRTKDTGGSFDKDHFKETPCASALPAVHGIRVSGWYFEIHPSTLCWQPLAK